MRPNPVMMRLPWMGWLASSSALGAVAWATATVRVPGCSARAPAQTGRKTMPLAVPTQPALRAQLLAMEQRDQQRRVVLGDAGGDPSAALLDQLRAMDAAYAARLRRWLAEGPLPTGQAVGADGMAALWRLVQHADLSLQQALLDHDGQLPGLGGMAPNRHAMLVDRVLQAQGKPQRHGSQFSRDATTGHLAMAPVEGLSGLDALRAQAGLMPMADYAGVLGASH